MNCLQISTEKFKGTSNGWIRSRCAAHCPQECIETWEAYIDGNWEKDATLAVTKLGEKRCI